MSKGGESVVFVVMFVVIAAIKLFKGFMESQQGGSKSKDWDDDGGWEDWETGGQKAGSASASRSTPPPQPKPVLTSAQPRSGVPHPTGRTISPALQEVIRERAEAKLREMAEKGNGPKVKRAQNRASAPPPPIPRRLSNPAAEAMGASLATAFPAARKMTRGIGAKSRAPIRLDGIGRANLRRGLLMSEVLGPPRAFDV